VNYLEYFGWNPQISVYGDRIWLVYRYRDGDIGRRRKLVQYSNFDQYDPERYWQPSCRYPYDPPEDVSIWEGHSSPYESNYPQGYASAVVWTEEVTQGGDPEIYLRDYDPDNSGEGHFWKIMFDNGNHLTQPDIFSHLNLVNDYDENQNRIATRYFVNWTEGSSGFYPYRTVFWIASHNWQSVSRQKSLIPGPADPITVSPTTPIYYEVKCGEQTPSFYCVKRDGFFAKDGHKVDIGKNELVYKFLIPEPHPYYLVRAIAWAPPDGQTFSFDGYEISISSDAVKSETLFIVLPPSLYQDGKVELRITGASGATLENLRFYQFVVSPDETPFKPQGLVSLQPLSKSPSLSVTPSFFQHSTTITYSLPKPEHIELTVYDLTGKVVNKLVDSEIQAGTHNIVWNRSNLPAGVYFVRLRGLGVSITDKVLLVR
jgi:hypothetical protein